MGYQFCSRSPLTPPSAEPAGLAQAEFARPGPGRAPRRDFSFPCYISPGSQLLSGVTVMTGGHRAAQLAGIEEVSAFHGDNDEALVHRFFGKDRAVMFELAGKLELVATSSDASVLAALEHARAYHAKPRGFIPLPAAVDRDGTEPGIAFASGNWRRVVTDRGHPGMVAGRHFEAMVFTYLAGELRTGDIAVVRAGEYAVGGLTPSQCPHEAGAGENGPR